jgi:hypothetical protein
MIPKEFATSEESATYTMLRQVLHNHFVTTALSYEDALNVILELFCKLCVLFYADICQAPGPVRDAEGRTLDIPGLVRHQIRWLKRSCHTRQQHPACLHKPIDRPAQFQADTPAPAALQFAHALQHLLKDASDAHHLHRAACISIVRALLADVLASVLFTTLGYTVEEADQVVEEHIAPALMTYLASHSSRLARARGHEPRD